MRGKGERSPSTRDVYLLVEVLAGAIAAEPDVAGAMAAEPEAAGAMAAEPEAAGVMAAELVAAGASAGFCAAGWLGAAVSGAFLLSLLPPLLQAAINATNAPAIKIRVNFIKLLPQVP